MSLEKTPAPTEHPLTEKYINLICEGLTSFDAALALVGPDLPRNIAAAQCARWEMDSLVQHRIEMRRKLQESLKQDVKRQAIERLLAIAFSDIRNYFSVNGPKPVHEWSKREAQAVKKIKFREMQDPFGNITRTYDVEFYDPVKGMNALKELFPEELADLLKDVIDVASLKDYTEDELEAVRKRLLLGDK